MKASDQRWEVLKFIEENYTIIKVSISYGKSMENTIAVKN